MKVLDLRPWPTRLAHALWRGKRDQSSGESEHLHSSGGGFGALVSCITRNRIKNRPNVPHHPYVVSVGNLALGGTGKTPVVSALAQDLAQQGLSGAILTRGYRSPLVGPVIVEPELANAGDEARLLARELDNHGWIVVQSKNRLTGLRWLEKQNLNIDIIIAEDAHQTPNLPRHLDVLILDKWHAGKEADHQIITPVCGPVFPFGPYRENSRGAQRAGIWLLETHNYAHLESKLNPEVGITTFTRQTHLPLDSVDSGSYGVLSGIARPWRFEKAMAAYTGQSPALSVRCNDHDSYGKQLVQKIVAAAHDAGVKSIITTAKDWVKLESDWPASLPVIVAGLKISWGNGKTLPDLIRERLDEHRSA
jgi:tetraacyldisaccharide 4'-kinase